jgi:rfaE bifunctional protein kinase chain/domain
MTTVSRDRAEALAGSFAGKRIVVLGDLMLDEFIWGRVRRISPEAPVPVVEVERQSRAIGGAGNVVSNLVALGAEASPLGVVGDDEAGVRLRESFVQLGVDPDGIVTDPTRPTTTKARIVAHNQQVVRADRESREPVSASVEDEIIRLFQAKIDRADAMVVSDYNKGLLTARLLSAVLRDAREKGRIVCLDPKMRSFSSYQPVTMITPNAQEAGEAAGVEIVDGKTLEEAGWKLLSSIDCSAVLITRGEEGMALFTAGAEIAHIPTVAREVYDVTGAGDTVIAALALSLASRGSFAEAAILANHAAGVVVGKLGTATVTREELLGTF